MSDEQRHDPLKKRRERLKEHLEPLKEHLKEPLEEAEKIVRTGKRKLRIFLHSAIGIGAVLLLGVIALYWYANTPQFIEMVRQRVVATLETSTGGHAELGGFHWSLWQRTVTIDNLTIHGLEKPGDAPYMHVDQIVAQLRWSGFFSGDAVNLRELRVVRPEVHLDVAADGTTNAPHPKVQSSTPLPQTLLELAVSQISVEHGVVLINVRAIPLDFAADNTTLTLKYISGMPSAMVGAGEEGREEHYMAEFESDDVRTRTFDEAQVDSQMLGQFVISGNSFSLNKFQWKTKKTELNATAELHDFAHPQWHGEMTGNVDVRQAAAITGIDGFAGGTSHIDVKGHSCDVAAAAAPKTNSLMPRLRRRLGLKPEPEPKKRETNTCNEAFVLEGTLTGNQAAWSNEFVKVVTAQTYTRVYVTPREMDFLDMHATLADGASGGGNLHIYNYMGVQPLHGMLTGHVADLPLKQILMGLAPKQYWSLDYNSAATGDAQVEWGETASTATVQGKLQFKPQSGGSGVPITGSVTAGYAGQSNTIKIISLAMNTPQSTATVSGVLGVLKGDALTALHADVTTRDLSEFDSVLRTTDFGGDMGSSGSAGLLKGNAEFHGTISGPIAQMETRGRLAGSDLDLPLAKLFPGNTWLQPQVHIDNFAGDLDLGPNGLALQRARIERGEAWIELDGRLKPSEQVKASVKSRGRGVVVDEWDKESGIDVSVKTHAFPLDAVLAIPVTGAVDIDTHFSGTFAAAHASGTIASHNGSLAFKQGGNTFVEPYKDLTATLGVDGTTWQMQNLTLTMAAGTLTGNAGYNTANSHIVWQAHTANFALSKLQSIAPQTGLTGALTLDASGNGTATEPNLQAKMTVSGLALQHQNAGQMDAEVRSSGRTVSYDVHVAAFGGQLTASGSTSMEPAHQTQAKASFSGIDLAPLVQLSKYRMSGKSELGGEVTLNGPLSDTSKLTGTASISRFHVELSGVALDAAEPLHISMAGSRINLEQVHITGQDTNLHLSGVSDLARQGRMRLHTDGNINLKILQIFDPSLLSSGQVSFTLDAIGSPMAPDYTGNVKINNAAFALIDVPNGLTQVNGTLAFNRDRLDLKQLTAMTGGGQVSLGGTITLRGGVYADITARGHDNRIRYPQGVSSSADTDLRLQGTPGNALLSGNVLLTRFGITQEFDFSSLASNAATVSALPDPNAPSSHLRLDVHITSAPQLDFQNSFARLVGDVDLNVRGTVASPTVLGRINITEGTATFAGTRYQLQSGDIVFSNPVHIDPQINLDATTRVRDYDIAIALHGSLENLRPTYRSEPPLPQSDILALLALGRTQQQAGIYQQQTQQGGADTTEDNTLLGGALNQTVSNRAQKLFGVGSVKVDPTFIGTLGNSSARITVEQSVTRDVTVTYATNVNQTAEQLIQVTWDINRNVSLVSQRDENGVFSMTFMIRQRKR